MTTPRTVKKVGRGGKRRLTGWTLIALGLLVAGVWGASGWWAVVWNNQQTYFGVYRGELALGSDSYLFAEEWSRKVEQIDPNLGSRFVLGIPPRPADIPGLSSTGWNASVVAFVKQDYARGYQPRTFELLLWPIPLLLWAAGVPVLRSGILARRRANTGACGKCGYSLAGLGADAKCPECGKGAGTK